MSNILIFAIVAITLALVFYTAGVFLERKSGCLNKNHLILFYLGLICDATGTTTMSKIASSGMGTMSHTGLMIHGITGLLAIIFMLFHAIWATLVIYKNDPKKKESFHKFSIVVWAIWLIPYIIGMILGMSK